MATTYDLQFQHPCSIIIAGSSSQSGKSMFVAKLLRNLQMFLASPFNRIIFCYMEFQLLYREMARENSGKLIGNFVKGIRQ